MHQVRDQNTPIRIISDTSMQVVLDRPEATLYNVDKVKQAIDKLDSVSTRHPEGSKSVPLAARLHAAASSILHLQSYIDKEGESVIRRPSKLLK